MTDRKEEFRVSGEELVEKIKEIIKEGNSRKIIIKNEDGESVAEFPLTIGAVGALIAPMLAAVGAIAAFWIILDRSYNHGNRFWFAFEIFSKAQNWVYYPSDIKIDETVAMFFGFGFVMFLAAMRRFLWWPIHPVAYPLILLDYTVRMMWINFIIAWLVKWVALKYGGLRLYRSLIPLFTGLLLGEFIVGGIWSLIGILSNVPVYAFCH